MNNLPVENVTMFGISKQVCSSNNHIGLINSSNAFLFLVALPTVV